MERDWPLFLTFIHNMLATCCYKENTVEAWLSRNCMYSKHICNPVKTQLSHVFKNTLRIRVFSLWIQSHEGRPVDCGLVFSVS